MNIENKKKEFEKMFKDDLKKFIVNQLSEMARNVINNSEKNIANRANNPFSLFEGDEEKYMSIGRSLDSQLGTRLQKIAFYNARYTYGFINVPNIVVMREEKEKLQVELLSYPIENGMTQCLYWGGYTIDYLSSKGKKMYDNSSHIFGMQSYEFDGAYIDEVKEILDKQGGKMPMDLFYIDAYDYAHSYEIKAGGNLDTKNKVENKNEVLRMEKVFSMFKNSISKFATCYNNRGEGNIPDGSIFSMLDEQHKAIGKAFWEEILPLEEISYDEFIHLYSEAFNMAKVREIISNKN